MNIILFGGFARGHWVDEPQNLHQSDWDLLIIVSHQKLTPIEDFWWEVEEKLLRDRRVKREVEPDSRSPAPAIQAVVLFH